MEIEENFSENDNSQSDQDSSSESELEVETETIKKEYKIQIEVDKVAKIKDPIEYLDKLDKKITEYQLFRPQYQDITPMFSDEIPFLVDADSLMITLMSDENWSNQLGGSTLHLVYLFERYLNIFVQRGGNFHLVFFQNWINIWDKNYILLLYRLILIKHFSNNSNFPIYIFDHCFDEEFNKLIASVRPGFILTNLDAYKNCPKFIKINHKYLKYTMNINLIKWLHMDVPVIDTNYITVNVSIVRGYYLNSKPDINDIFKLYDNIFSKFINREYYKNKISNIPMMSKMPTLPTDIRRAVFVNSAFFYYKQTANENWVKIFFVTAAMMELLELKNRCCPKLTADFHELENIVSEWHKYMFYALSKTEILDYTTVVDLWQGLIFGHVCRFLLAPIESAKELGTDISLIYEDLIECFNQYEFHIQPYPINELKLNISYETNKPVDTPHKDIELVWPIKNPLVSKFCGNILRNLKWTDPPNDIIQKVFSEEHHYHSMKIIYDEHDRIKDKNIFCNERSRLRNIAMQARYMQFYGSNIEGRSLTVSGVIRENQNEIKKNKNTKKNKISKKAQAIIDAKNRNDLKNEEEKYKRELENLKEEYKKSREHLKLLTKIDQNLSKVVNKNYKNKFLLLKLEILLKLYSNNSTDNLKIQKEIFLIARDILTSTYELLPEDKFLLNKSLEIINCKEISHRNNLVIEKDNQSDDFWIRFQLEHLGPELIQETNGNFDKRAKNFIPDLWQIELFDIVDKRESALIVAPTSSGKTYASYYCMESVLREGSDGVVVYVAPTKPLVNQVAATVYARFKDTNMPRGKTVYGVFTRDFRINSLNCQILVTVPECLEILLMSPRRYKWVQSLRYVIFDEIHCLGGQMGGDSFERCLLLIRCPFLALSATIRHPKKLYNWMQTFEDYKYKEDKESGLIRNSSYKVHLIQHLERHSDLIKYTYGGGQLLHLHPYANLDANVLKRHSEIPKHLSLSPFETLQLYDAMKQVYNSSKDLQLLNPLIFFAKKSQNGFLTRNLVKAYGQQLSLLLENWFQNSQTLKYFEETINNLKPPMNDNIVGTGKQYIIENLPDFITLLNDQKMLPALVFAYDRWLIENMTKVTTNYFEKKKQNYLLTNNAKNQSQISRINEKLDKIHSKKYKQQALSSYTDSSKNSLSQIANDEYKTDRKNMPRYVVKDPKRLNLISEPGQGSLQGIGVITSDDIKYIEDRLYKEIGDSQSKHYIVKAIQNGICLHHGGLGNKIRTTVEMLFRRRLLNLVFATGTLALGIHMPCKTAVIAGTSAYLNSLEYHQMAGRAGRRGFDITGNVIFYGINPRKQHTLLTAKLPVLKGNFPINVSLILRSLLLISDVTENNKKTDVATNSTISRVMTLLENSLCFFDDPDLIINIKHFFCFSLQLLKIQGFINNEGLPLKWCGLGTHLHYHEPGNLAFVYLLRTGIFRTLCESEKDEKTIQYQLMIILCYLFTNHPLDAASDAEYDNSVVVLEPLPDIVYEALKNYNKEVLFVFNQYNANVASYFQDSDNELPLTNLKVIGKKVTEKIHTDNLQNKFLNTFVPHLICSSFAALSGNNDEHIYSHESLINNMKRKLSTDVKVVPIINLDAKLNAYALDFYRHGIIKAIIKDNGLKAGLEFSLIKDFLLVLRTIITSLEAMELKNEDKIYFHFKKLETVFSENFSNSFDKGHF